MRPVNLREGCLESPARVKVCTNKIALQTCNQSTCTHYPLLMFEIEHPINVRGNWGSGLSDFAPLRWLQQGPWLESAINFPSFVCCIIMEVFSFPAGGFGQRAQHLGARPGSLDWGKRTLPGQRGKIDIAPVLRQDRKVQCKSEALLRSRKVSGARESFL